MQVYSAEWVLPVGADPIEDGAVGVESGRITAVGSANELGRGRRFDCAAIVPGFVNGHSHLEYSAYAGFGDGLEFAPWIVLHTERKGRLEWDDFIALSRLGAAECLRSGITTVGDLSFSGASAPACAELGLRAIVYLEVFGETAAHVLERFEHLRVPVEDSFSDRVRLGVSPHSPYTVGLEGFEACARLGLPLATHLAESEAETAWLTRGEGPLAQFRLFLVPPPGATGIRHLARHGLLDANVTAGHCVKADEEEIALLTKHDTAVVHCPRSNALLGCGLAPVGELRAAGARVGLGTDSPASTPSFDMFDELRAALFAARAREQRPDALTATEALELATLGSARALALEDEVGSLQAGKRADFAVVSLADSPYYPCEDPAAAVVLGGSPERVLLTVVEGEIRYEKGGVEWHEVRQRAANARSRMLAGGGSSSPSGAPVGAPA